MKIIHGGQMPFAERNNPRGGTFHFKRLVEGAAGTPGNFGLMLSRTYDNFVSPRHRHNFEQIRYQIEGVSSFGRDGDMTPGTVGYFPEGAFYGPQSAEGPALVLVLQYGGPSGAGYMSEDDLQRSVEQLNKVGEFKAGVFYRGEGEGRPRQDAYEAAWENWNGRRMDYPEPLYPGPILTQGDAAAWEDLAPGVRRQIFGAFKGGTAVSILSLNDDAQRTVAGGCVLFVVDGEGAADGEAIETHASIHVDAGESIDLRAGSGLTVLTMQLPVIAAHAEHITRAA